jgi:hypothetical protein
LFAFGDVFIETFENWIWAGGSDSTHVQVAAERRPVFTPVSDLGLDISTVRFGNSAQHIWTLIPLNVVLFRDISDRPDQPFFRFVSDIVAHRGIALKKRPLTVDWKIATDADWKRFLNFSSDVRNAS